MTSSGAYVIEMPTTGTADDLWCVEFSHNVGLYRVTNVSMKAAFWAQRNVHIQAPGGMASCIECHEERRRYCPHDSQLAWLWVDMSECRIFPMSEAA